MHRLTEQILVSIAVSEQHCEFQDSTKSRRTRLLTEQQDVAGRASCGERDPPLLQYCDGDILYSRSSRLRGQAYLAADIDLTTLEGPGCWKCKRLVPTVLEHLIPQRRGGEHRLSNLHHYCDDCNRKKGGQERQELPGVALGKRERGSSDDVGPSRTERIHNDVDYSKGSIEHQINDNAEVEFRNWLLARVKSHGSIPWRLAANAGAESVGISPETIERYRDKATNEINGILKTYREPNYPRRKFIVALKPDILNFALMIQNGTVNDDEIKIFQEAHAINLSGAP
jgi:5-methylcytosine-specific restriction endonuclease McrA